MAKYDSIYGKGVTEIFGEELLDYFFDDTILHDYNRSLELELIQRMKSLNKRYHDNCLEIEKNLELCKQFWNYYKMGITFIAEFIGYDEIKNETREELSFYLLDYLTDGPCDANFIIDTFTWMVNVKGNIDRLTE